MGHWIDYSEDLASVEGMISPRLNTALEPSNKS